MTEPDFITTADRDRLRAHLVEEFGGELLTRVGKFAETETLLDTVEKMLAARIRVEYDKRPVDRYPTEHVLARHLMTDVRWLLAGVWGDAYQAGIADTIDRYDESARDGVPTPGDNVFRHPARPNPFEIPARPARPDLDPQIDEAIDRIARGDEHHYRVRIGERDYHLAYGFGGSLKRVNVAEDEQGRVVEDDETAYVVARLSSGLEGR